MTDYNCFVCNLTFEHEAELSQHVIRYHKNEPGFIVKCSFCGASYRLYNSFQRHLRRKHAVETSSFEPSFAHADSLPTACFNGMCSFSDEVNNKVAGLVLKLTGRHNVSQAVADTVVENVAEILDCVKARMTVAVENHKLDGDYDRFNELMDISLLGNFQSHFLQRKYFTEELGMVEPVRVKVGQSYVMHKSGRLKLSNRFGYVVPFIPNLSKLLSCPEVMSELSQCHESDDDFSYDVCDGEFVKSHPLYEGDRNFLQFMLYCDELELCNSIGAHTKIHKVTMWYWLLLNIRPLYRSRLPVIQLLAVVKSAYVKQFGTEHILADFLQGMKDLSAGVALPGIGIKTGALVVVVADTPAANQVGGFKEGVGFASRKCRTCNCSADEMTEFFREHDFRLRTDSEHVGRCETLQSLSRAARAFWSKEYGINSRSTLLDFPHFSITSCLLHDVMHVLFEGVCPLELRLVLRHIICDQKHVSLDVLNSLVHNFSYGSSWSRMKPSKIEREQLTDDSKSFKQDSSQMWCLIMHLPILIGSLVPVSDERWLNLLRLQQIVILCMSHRTSLLTVAQLEHVISVHNYMFRKLYPSVSYIPKLHFLVHLPTQISRFGPARNMWAMRMEAKNGKFKRKKWNNFKNLPYSLSKFHQQSMCFEQTTGSGEPNQFFLRTPDLIAEGQMIRVGSYRHSEVLIAKYNVFSDLQTMLLQPKQITVHGITYRHQDMLYYSRASDYSMPSFVSVDDIIVHDTLKLLLLQPLDIVSYDSHRNCYVTEYSMSPVFCSVISDLWCPRPLIESAADVVITEDYIVEEL